MVKEECIRICISGLSVKSRVPWQEQMLFDNFIYNLMPRLILIVTQSCSMNIRIDLHNLL